jgi:small basic protein (TIGR04137 family)
MSQHPSLRSGDKNKAHRSVLKRYERIKTLKEKELWKQEDSVYGLPKVKILRFKIKKEKAAAAAEGTEASAAPAEGAAPAAKAAAPAAKTAASAKAPAQDTKKEAKK